MSTRTFVARCILHAMQALACAVVIVTCAQAADDPRRQYDLPAGDAVTTLRQFAEISGREILYASEIVRGVRTAAVKGEFTALEALEHMLAGTNLYAIPEEALALRQIPSAPPDGQPALRKKPNKPPPMKFRRIFPFLAGWIIAGASINAQSAGTIEGRVLNAVTGDYLGNARLAVEGTSLQTLSNEYGEYRIANVPTGHATLRVFYSGLVSQTVAIEVAAGQTVTRTISLAPAGLAATKEGETLQLDPFLVASSKETNAAEIAINEQRFSPNIKNVLSADEFGGVTEGNVGEFVKFLPGVTINYAGADARTAGVRGMADTSTVVTVDGNAVPPSVAGPATRAFGFDQLSLNNLARIELTKGPTPDGNADAIGGTINLVSKSAFERSRPEFKYRAYLAMNEQDQRDLHSLSFNRTPGPGREPSSKIRPGVDFSYVNPVNKNFGFTVTGSNSNIFNPENGSNVRWNPTSNASPTLGTLANPVMSAYLPEWGWKMTSRYSLAATADFRIAERHVVKVGGSWNAFDAMLNSTAATINASTPTAWGPTYTQGANAGSISWAPFHRSSDRSTYLLNARYQYNGKIWKFEASGYSSHSEGEDKDMEEGYFIQFTYNMTGLRLRFDDINETRPSAIGVTTAAGGAADIRKLADYTLRTAQTAPGVFSGTANGAKASMQGIVDLLGRPIQIKVGVDARRVIADSRKTTQTWTFVDPMDGLERPTIGSATTT
jgi:iron complex outermembrane receptor protein